MGRTTDSQRVRRARFLDEIERDARRFAREAKDDAATGSYAHRFKYEIAGGYGSQMTDAYGTDVAHDIAQKFHEFVYDELRRSPYEVKVNKLNDFTVYR